MAFGSCTLAGSRRSSSGLPGATASEAIASAWCRPAPATPDDVQAACGELGGVAGQVATRPLVDELVARDPDLPAVVGVPVTLLVARVDQHTLNLKGSDPLRVVEGCCGYGLLVPEQWSHT